MTDRLKKGAFTFIILVAAIAFVIGALQYGPKARMMPLIIGIPTILVAIIQLIFDLTGLEKKKAAKKKDDVPDEHSIFGKASGKQTAVVFISLFIFFALIYLVGFRLAVPLYFLIFLVGIARKKILPALLYTVVLSGILYFMFVIILQAQLYKGILFGAF